MLLIFGKCRLITGQLNLCMNIILIIHESPGILSSEKRFFSILSCIPIVPDSKEKRRQTTVINEEKKSKCVLLFM